MSKLSDVQFSQQGEVVTRVREVKDINKIAGLVKYPKDKDGKIIYPSGKQWYLFKLVDNNRKGGVYIPNIDDVKNPETGVVERARLLSGVSSIWVKDQKDLSPDYIKQNGRSIEFPRGHKMLRVSADDATMLYYARVTNSNVGNPDKVKSSRFEFYEYDFAAAENEAFEKEQLAFEVETMARTEKPEAMRKHAAFLGVRMVNDIGEVKTDEGVRREYARIAKQNPEYFKRTRNTAQIEISWLVRRAIAEGIIDIGSVPGQILWANGGGVICVLPQTMNPQDVLTELALTNNEEGIRFKEQLKQVAT
ncbi:MAG: hypothetical protein ABUT20_64555 [Bacteroidota bacterium]